MRLGWTTSKYSTTYRAVKTIRVSGKNKTEIVKCAYLFLQAVCYELGLHKICIAISSRHGYDIDSKPIEAEAALNGFYAVCANLGDDLEAIVG